jgi:hypothetical protein
MKIFCLLRKLHYQEFYIKSEVLTTVKMMLLFWVVTPCGLVGRHQRFGETYFLSTEDGGSTFLRNVVIYL